MKRKSLLFLLLFALLAPWAANAQSLSEYSFSTDMTTFNSIVSTGTPLSFSNADDGYATCTFPFTFMYGESSFESGASIACSANGFIYLGASSLSGTTGGYNSTSYRAVNAILQQDGHIGRYSDDDPSGAYTKYDADAGTFTIEYHKLGTYGSPYGSYSYQVVFHNNGDIEFIYDEVDLGGATSRTLATYLTDGPNNDRVFVTDAWASPIIASAYAARPIDPLPAQGLRYTFTRPVIAYPKPTNFHMTSSDHESVSFEWTAPAASSNTLTGYAYQYKEANVTDWPTNWTAGVDATATTLTISGLTATTSYNFRLKALYGSNESDVVTADGATTAVALAVGDAWSDDFEGETCGWELINGDLADAWVWGTATNNGGTHAIYISDDGGTTWNYGHDYVKVLAAKLLAFTEDKFTFSYDWNCYGESNYDFLRVALVPASQTLTAGSDYGTISTTSLPTGWIALDGGKLNQVQTWQNKEVTINVSAGNYYLVFAWRSDSSTQNQPPAAVDNVSITRMACSYEVEGLAVNNITTSGATLSWEGGEATQWQVAYSTSNTFEGATEEIVDAATYTMSGLNPSTVYYAKVRAYCGGEDYGEWSNVLSFPTACDVIPALGYTENFDSYTAGANVLPICWNYINTTTNTTYAVYPRVYANSSWSTYANSAPNCLYFYSYYSSSYEYDPQDQYAILPAMEGLNGKQITLFAKGGNANSAFKVGMMTDPADANTFVEIATQALTTSYQEFNYILGEGNYVAIMIEAANADRTSNSVYIDDIVIAEAPTCLKPTDLAAIPSTTSAVLSWTAGGTETAWTVYYKKTTDEAYTEMPNATNPYTLNGLEAATAYQYYVVANCSETEASAPSAVFNFTTECEAYAIPYTYDFEDGASFTCWNPISGNVTRYNNSSNAHGGTYYLDFRGTTSNMIALPQFTEETSTLAIEFWTRPESTGGSSGKFAVGYMTDLNDANTFVAVETYNSTEMTTTYVQKTVYFTGAPAGAYIAMRQFDCATYYYWFVDDITVMEAPTCITPTNLAVSNITGHTAELSWTAGGEETAWQICINRDETNLIDVTTNPYTLPELAPETEYIVMVRANCGEEDGVSAWSNEVVFTTDVACPAPTALTVSDVTPFAANVSWTGDAEGYTLRYRALGNDASGFNYGFEDAEPWTITDFSPCTVYDGDGGTTYGFSSWTFTNAYYVGACIAFNNDNEGGGSMVSHSGDAFGVMFSNGADEDGNPVQNNDWFILPELTIAEGDVFSFWGREIVTTYGPETINVGIYGSTDGTFASVIASNVSVSTTEYEKFEYDLSAYAGQTIKLAINYVSTDVFGFMFDDIFVGNPNAITWDVTDNAAASPYPMTGLSAGTAYEVQVQANCGEDGYSEWTTINFSTPTICNSITTLPIDETTLTETSATLSWTGYSDSYNVRYRTAEDADILLFEDFSNGMGDWTTNNMNSSSGIYEDSWFRFHWSTTPPQYLISPELEGVVDGTYLQFIYAAPSTSWTETFQVGYSSTGTDVDADFTWGEVIETVNNTGEYYTEQIPAGTKYFAIKCTSNDQYYLYVTNFMVYANYVAAGEWQYVNNVTTTSTTLNDLVSGTWYEWQVQGADCGDNWIDGEAFQTLATVTQTMELTAGWNWVSTYIDLDGVDAITLIEEALGDNGMTIATFDDAAVNLGGGMWFGLEGYTLSNSEMIMIEVAEDCSFTLEGPAVDPSTITITINPEWNWIGFPVANETSINDALAGFAAEFEDQIANFTGATVNFGDWIGDFETLVPGQGYMYFYNGTEPQDLIFQTGAKSRSIISNLSKPMKVTNNNTVEKNSLMNKSIKGTK